MIISVNKTGHTPIPYVIYGPFYGEIGDDLGATILKWNDGIFQERVEFFTKGLYIYIW